MDIDNTTTAFVDNNVAIDSGDLGGFNMKAEEAIMNFNFSQAGASAGKYAIGGTLAKVNQESDTLAQLDSGAIVTGKSVKVYAGSLETQVNWAGGVAKGKNLGVGVSIAINDIDRSTNAIIGELEPADGSPIFIAESAAPNINVTDYVLVDAKATGSIWAGTVAAALASRGKAATPSKTPKSAGALSVGGAFSFNNINTKDGNTRASISHAAVVRAGGEIHVNADDATGVVANVGGVAVSVVSQSSSTGSNAAGGVGVAVSVNTIENAIEAYIDNAKVTATGDVKITAASDAEIDAIALGGAIAVAASNKSAGSLALGGAFTFNDITTSVEASVKRDSQVTTQSTGNVILSAR